MVKNYFTHISFIGFYPKRTVFQNQHFFNSSCLQYPNWRFILYTLWEPIEMRMFSIKKCFKTIQKIPVQLVKQRFLKIYFRFCIFWQILQKILLYVFRLWCLDPKIPLFNAKLAGDFTLYLILKSIACSPGKCIITRGN